MKLNEIRKEDDCYYQGPFWIIADSFKEILRGNFEILSEKFLCDYTGNDLSITSKSSKVHKKIWINKYQNTYNCDFDFYPRGRVSIYEGTAFIHINSKCNIPSIIDKITEIYDIERLEIEVEENDLTQGHHYNFNLK